MIQKSIIYCMHSQFLLVSFVFPCFLILKFYSKWLFSLILACSIEIWSDSISVELVIFCILYPVEDNTSFHDSVEYVRNLRHLIKDCIWASCSLDFWLQNVMYMIKGVYWQILTFFLWEWCSFFFTNLIESHKQMNFLIW